MAAETLKCPMCGASASSDATRCAHCSSRLATIACPSCFGMMFLGARFCSHCGAEAQRQELPSDEPHPCPRCSTELTPVRVGKNLLRECSKCEGVWADADSLQRIYAGHEEQAAILGNATAVPSSLTGTFEQVRYVRCPVCSQLMHRVNFARCSHVVVDVCKPHGTWFDRDELRRIIEFIGAGGFIKSREMEVRELERRQRSLQNTPENSASIFTKRLNSPITPAHSIEDALTAAGQLVKLFLR